MATNLLEVLSKEDKKLIERYIALYGTTEDCVCDIDYYLRYWAQHKTKLYHLLGDQLIVKIPYKKELDDLQMRVIWEKNLNLKVHPIFEYIKKIINFFIANSNSNTEEDFNLLYRTLYKTTSPWIADKIGIELKVKIKDKTIQFTKNMKPLKAISKIISFFKKIETTSENEIKDIDKEYEDFRIHHSRWKDERIFKGNLVFSIHPMDFLTMSDNNSDWSSCMSWVKEGCYRIGTVEMMNSNNVMCVYLESLSTPFVFDAENHLEWNNKKWRELFYITKDIILCGVEYPYSNKDLSSTALDFLRTLAKDNMHWKYAFGPEPYKDMRYINSREDINRVRDFIDMGATKKHNIIFSTEGMYNDFMEKSIENMCVRNKVKKNKVISISGPTVCACCGDASILEYNYNYDDEEPYGNTGDVYCEECKGENTCSNCEQFASPAQRLVAKYINNNAQEKEYCVKCKNRDDFYICSCCKKVKYIGDITYNSEQNQNFYYFAFKTPYFNAKEIKEKDTFCFKKKIATQLCSNYYSNKEEYYNHTKPPILFGLVCLDCIPKFLEDNNKDFTKIKVSGTWFNDIDTMNLMLSNNVYTLEELSNHPIYSQIII